METRPESPTSSGCWPPSASSEEKIDGLRSEESWRRRMQTYCVCWLLAANSYAPHKQSCRQS
eukprot:2310130-Pyramimonas_sp.AAC.1